MIADFAIETIYRRERLKAALSKMNTDYQRLAVILYLMGYKQYEIAEVYGVSKQRISQVVTEFKQRNGIYWSEQQ